MVAYKDQDKWHQYIPYKWNCQITLNISIYGGKQGKVP